METATQPLNKPSAVVHATVAGAIVAAWSTIASSSAVLANAFVLSNQEDSGTFVVAWLRASSFMHSTTRLHCALPSLFFFSLSLTHTHTQRCHGGCARITFDCSRI
ncbi:hypothetical protein EON66_02920 [archaeon]|nr:MAG: hypothetical protein EON66_02920 [archaeon]